MTVNEAIKALSCNQQELAAKLGVTKVAVSQWVKNGCIPIAREYQIKDLILGIKPILRDCKVA